jgi:hypothetical protein
MKIATTMKTLTLLGLTTLTLTAAPSQADNGYVFFGRAPMTDPVPWGAVPPNANPWLNNAAFQQARFAAVVKQRQAQLDQRQDTQMQRILNGMDSGRLSSREAAGLLREHLAIADLERNFMSDGRLGPDELASLERRLSDAERHITFEQNDREKAAPGGHPGDGGRSGDMGRQGEYGRH